MKLLMVISSLSGGGAERAMSDLASAWASRGWEVCVATFTGTDEEDFYALHERVRRVHLGRGPQPNTLWQKVAGNLRRVRCLRRLLRAETPHAMLSFMDSTNVTAILAGFGLGVRVVVSERIDPGADTTINPFWRTARALLYRYADQVVAQTETAARWLRQHCRTDVVVIPNFMRNPPSVTARREPLLLSVGRLYDQKGFDVLLRAFARIHQRHPEWRLGILGEGPEREALLRLRHTLGLDDKAFFQGQVRDIECWYAKAGLLVQASRFEGFPNVLLEAMAMGTPVISTACPSGPTDLIDDGVNGRLVPVEDDEALARSLSELMSDERERLRLGLAAQQVRTRYSPARVLPLWETVLRGTAPSRLGTENAG